MELLIPHSGWELGVFYFYSIGFLQTDFEKRKAWFFDFGNLNRIWEQGKRDGHSSVAVIKWQMFPLSPIHQLKEWKEWKSFRLCTHQVKLWLSIKDNGGDEAGAGNSNLTSPLGPDGTFLLYSTLTPTFFKKWISFLLFKNPVLRFLPVAGNSLLLETYTGCLRKCWSSSSIGYAADKECPQDAIMHLH